MENIWRNIYDSLGKRYVWVFWLFSLIVILTLACSTYTWSTIVHWQDNSWRLQYNVYDNTSTIEFLMNTSHILNSVLSGIFYTKYSVSFEQCRTKQKQVISSPGKLTIHLHCMNNQWTTSHKRTTVAVYWWRLINLSS